MNKLIKKLTSHPLMAGSAIIFVGSMVSNAASYLYHLLTGRILGPAGYGELASLISLLYIFGVPTSVLSTVLIKYFSKCKADNSPGEAKDLYIRMMQILSKISIILLILFLVVTPFIGSFLNLTTTRSLIWVFIGFVLSIFAWVNMSVMQGFQLFLWVSAFGALGMILKLCISTPLANFGVEWTMIGSVIAAIIAFGLFFLPIRFVLQAKRRSFPLTKKELLAFSIPTFLTLLGFTSLYSMDIVLARHFLTPKESGLYSAIATLGKVIFYASSAVVTVLFPVLSERTAKSEPVGKILGIALGLVGVISIGVTLIYFLVPEMIIHLLFGASYDGASSYLGFFACFISIYSLGNVLVLTCLAANKLSIWILTVLAAVSQAVLISLFHQSIMDIVIVNLSVIMVFVLSAGLYYLRGIETAKNTT
jgi:O-antigen/teichoic acid export membrane protein